MTPRLDRALAGVADRPDYEAKGRTSDRRQIMAVINELSSPTH
jgi:hypothetical protein